MMNENLVPILKKMCEMVGADYDKIDFKKDGWYWEYQWTKEQESEFQKWMVEYLMNNKGARDILMHWPRKGKKLVTEAVKAFIWNHGWKVSE